MYKKKKIETVKIFRTILEDFNQINKHALITSCIIALFCMNQIISFKTVN